VIGKRRKLHKAQLQSFYSSTNIMRVIKSKRIRQINHTACMDKRRNSHNILDRKPEGKKLLGKPRHREGDYIKMALREIGYKYVD
jgi:hypothetical protein